MHELGHFIGLGHSTTSGAVMINGWSTSVPTNPQEDDECAVNDIYTNTTYSVTC